MFSNISNTKKIKEKISKQGRQMLWSIFLFALACPMIDLFTSFFLWKNGKSISLLIIYLVSHYIASTFSFFVNGFLMRRLSPVKLYSLGCLTLGLAPFVLITFTTIHPWQVMLAGGALGLAKGVLWGNRHILTDDITKVDDRLTFMHRDFITSAVAGVITPVIVGWFLVFGQNTHWYSVNTAYHIMAIVEVILLVGAGLVIHLFPETAEKKQIIFLKNADPLWRSQRNWSLTGGIELGISAILPFILMIQFLNKENNIGTLSSCLALISAVVMIRAVQWKTKQARITMLKWWAMLTLIATGIVLQFFNMYGVILYLAILAGIHGFRCTAELSLAFDEIDKENDQKRYAYLLDREWHLNIGRIMGLVLFGICYALFPETSIANFLIVSAILKTAFFLQARNLHNQLTGKVENQLALATVTIENK